MTGPSARQSRAKRKGQQPASGFDIGPSVGAAASLTIGDPHVEQQAAELAAFRLRFAAGWLRARAPAGAPHPVGLRDGGVPAFIARHDLDGVLRVFDAADGTLVAESAPGRLTELADGFVPPRPGP